MTRPAPLCPYPSLCRAVGCGTVETGTSSGAATRVRADIAGRPIDLTLPAGVQTVTGDDLETLVAAPGGGAVLARARDADLYILADPDLIDNLAFASRDGARGAALLLDAIAEDANAEIGRAHV